MGERIRIATRASKLARWQANWVAARLGELGVETEFVPITTRGDTDQRPMGMVGGTNVFTKEVQAAVLEGLADVAVHSLKDLGTSPPAELTLAAVPARGPTRDTLVSKGSVLLEALPTGAVVGTGSLRRRAQLTFFRPDLDIRDIRGNVETRIAKLDRGEYDAVVLAEAGLRRLALEDRISEILGEAVMLPAVGQGALGLETRADDAAARETIGRLDDPSTRAAVTAERRLLAVLEGGCMAPIAASGRVDEDTKRLILIARVVRADGRERLEDTEEGDPRDAADIGEKLARRLLDAGAAELICFGRGR